MRDLETKIRSGSLTVDQIYKLIHEHIMYKYSRQDPPITSSETLLTFIHSELPVLSATASKLYIGVKDTVEFKIYLPLIVIFIIYCLMENFALPAPLDVMTVAEEIKRIVSARICAFINISGEPGICFRPTIQDDIISGVIDAANQFLSTRFGNYVAPVAPAPDPLQDEAPAQLQDDPESGGNRRRIKKYKYRTSRRSSRRTSRRTSRVTKYRTNRYKIKNKKTRKIR